MRDNPTMTRAIKIQELTYTYPHAEKPSLSQVNLSIESGQFTVIMGASGAGKTTLTLCLNGLIPQLLEGQLQGKVEVDGLDVSKYRTQTLAQRVGIVFQDPESQIVGLTVEEDVAFGPRNFMLPEEEIQNLVHEALSQVRLSGYELRKTEELSGGEKQRLAIAGVLAMRPDILVLDEPTSELDPAGRAEVFATIDNLRNKKEMTILIVEPCAEEVINRANEIVVMRKGEISWQGNPWVLFRNLPLLQELGLRPVPISIPFWKFYQQGWITAEEIPLSIPEAFETLQNMLRRGVCLESQPKVELKLISSLNTRGAVEIKNLQYCYGNAEPTLKGINLSIASGEFLALLGSNGAGKSTAYENLKDISNLYNDITFINPDVITKQSAQRLGYGSVNNLPKELQRIINIQVGKQALRIRKESLDKRINFGIETTASSESILRLIDNEFSVP